MQDKNFQKSSTIRDTLLRLGVIKNENIEIFSKHTRDIDNLTVYRDKNSKVIFIDEYYVGDEEYASGNYRTHPAPLTSSTNADLEDFLDTERRYNTYKQFIVNKKICDFGCGKGNFLRTAKPYSQSSTGIEIQQNFNSELNNDGIKCLSKLDELPEPMDVFFMFHCLEHLPNPSKTLKEIHGKLKSDDEGKIIIEVPHAKDFLLDQLEFEPFKNFTLWSQHLILHTRESLNSLLLDAGFKNIHIEGIQRYGIANHLSWLKNKKPGGHKELLSIFETENLKNSYAEALSKLDANDTLVATATT